MGDNGAVPQYAKSFVGVHSATLSERSCCSHFSQKHPSDNQGITAVSL